MGIQWRPQMKDKDNRKITQSKKSYNRKKLPKPEEDTKSKDTK